MVFRSINWNSGDNFSTSIFEKTNSRLEEIIDYKWKPVYSILHGYRFSRYRPNIITKVMFFFADEFEIQIEVKRIMSSFSIHILKIIVLFQLKSEQENKMRHTDCVKKCFSIKHE
jgi:hypothetical protein